MTEELVGFPAYNDGEGPSATSVSTSRACSIRCVGDVQAMAMKLGVGFQWCVLFWQIDELALLIGKTVEIIHCREIKRVDKRMTQH